MKKLFKKLTKKTILAILAIIVIGLPVLYLTVLNQKEASAWFDENWNYRAAVPISAHTSAENNVFVTLTLDTATPITAGKMQSDCGDLRFTKENGEILPYFINASPGCNNAATTIQVNFDSFPAGAQTIYYYYGNPSAPNGFNSAAFTTAATGATIGSVGSEAQGPGPIGYWKFDDAQGTTAYTSAHNLSGTTTNLVTNPSFEVDTSSWVAYSGATLTRTTGQSYFGTAAASAVTDGSTSQGGIRTTAYITGISANTSYTASGWVKGDNNQAYLFGIREYNSSGTILATTYTSFTGTGSWQWITSTVTTNASTDRVNVMIRSNDSNQTTFYVDGVQLEQKSSATPYCDGSLSGTGTYAWTGTANASTSTCIYNTNGYLTGTTAPAWKTEDQCIAGKCLYFDGSTSNVSVAANQTGVQTVAMWVQPISVTSSALLDFDFGTHKVTVSSGTISATGFTSPTIYVNGVVSSTLTANKWQYVVVTTGTAFNSNPNLTIGKASTTYLNGFIDDVKIYPYARTAAQVKQDYLAGKANAGTKQGTSAAIGSNPSAWISDGLVGYWKMDESSGDRTDSSGNSNTLTDTNTVTSNPGKFGNAGQFTRANSEKLTITDNTALSTGDIDFTLAGWFYLDAVNVTQGLINKWGGAGSREYQLFYSSTNPGFTFGVSSNGTASNSVVATTQGAASTGTWYYVLAWHDSVNNTLNIQVNNGTVDSSAYSSGVFDSTDNFDLGDITGSSYFGGRMDEIRMYKRVLPAKERTDLYNWAPGPVGYWDFEEGGNLGVGSTAYDRSGNSNPGIWAGTGSKHSDAGKYGKAGNFNGSDDYVNLGNQAVYKPGSASFTVMAWVKSTVNQAKRIVTIREATSPARTTYDLYSTSDVYRFDVADGTNAVTPAESGISASDGKWHHITGVIDRSSNLAILYVDGIKQNSGSISGFGAISPNASLIIGDFSTSWWNGQIDEVKVYNYARTQKQIVSDMNAGHPAVGSPVGSAVGYWKFDEGQGQTANNSGSQGSTLNGTLGATTGSSTDDPTWSQAGKFGKALSFDGGDVVNVTGSFISANALTVSAWINPSNFTVDTAGIVSGFSGGGYRLITEDTGAFSFGYRENPGTYSVCTSTTILSAGTWYHVLATFDGSQTNKVNLYLDGKLNKTCAGVDSTILINNFAKIGYNSDNTAYYTGLIDEPKIYNYALTADEVKTEYNRGSSLVLGAAGNNSTYQPQAANQEYCVPGDSTSCAAPVGRWDFEEGIGTSANDTSGNGNTGTLTGATDLPTWTSGKIGKAIKFDGSDDYVNCGTGASLDITSAVTLEGWIKLNTLGVYQEIVSKVSSAGIGYSLRVDTNNKLNLVIGSSGNGWAGGGGNTALSANVWYHVTGLWDGTNVKFYLNGVNDTAGSPTSASLGVPSPNQPCTIGRISYGGDYLNGLIDQVRIYNYARTPAQIAWDYNRGKPVGWWKMDECQGTTANDSSGNGNTGTITIGALGEDTVGTCTTSSTAWGSGATGKRNASLSFDGTDDYVSSTPSNPTSVTGSFTVSAWVKPNTPTTAITFFGTRNGSTYGFDAKLQSGNLIHGDIGTGTAWITTSADASFNYSVGNWYHIVYTFTTTGYTIYANGVQVGSGTFASNTPLLYDSTHNIFIGQTGASNQYFNGQIDDVRVFNYALTSTQVKDIYNGGAVNFGPSTGSP